MANSIHKLAQTSFFLVLGAVLAMVAVFSSFFLINESPSFSKDTGIARPVVNFLEGCLEQTAHQGMASVLVKGGYHEAPEDSRQVIDTTVPYYWKNGKSTHPSIEEVEQEHASFVESNLEKCVGDFEDLNQLGLEINTRGTPKATSQFGEEKSQVVIQQRIDVVSGDQIATINKFSASLDFTPRPLLEQAHSFMKSQEQTPQAIPLSSLLDISRDSPFEFQYHYVSDDTVLYAIMPDTNPEHILTFLSEYNWDNSEPTPSLSLSPLRTITLTSSQLVQVQAEAFGEDLTFSDNSDVFEIHPITGLIAFDPDNLENGEYESTITVTDKNGNSEETLFRFVIDFRKELVLIDEIPEIEAVVGEIITRTASARSTTEFPILYSDDSSFFDIDPLSGEFSFTPEQAGTYLFTITAAVPGAQASETVKAVIS